MKLLYTIDEAAEATGLSANFISDAIKGAPSKYDKRSAFTAPRLRARKASGNIRRITHADLAAWVDQLPDYDN